VTARVLFVAIPSRCVYVPNREFHLGAPLITARPVASTAQYPLARNRLIDFDLQTARVRRVSDNGACAAHRIAEQIRNRAAQSIRRQNLQVKLLQFVGNDREERVDRQVNRCAIRRPERRHGLACKADIFPTSQRFRDEPTGFLIFGKSTLQPVDIYKKSRDDNVSLGLVRRRGTGRCRRRDLCVRKYGACKN
jgi:hypothetical protein